MPLYSLFAKPPFHKVNIRIMNHPFVNVFCQKNCLQTRTETFDNVFLYNDSNVLLISIR